MRVKSVQSSTLIKGLQLFIVKKYFLQLHIEKCVKNISGKYPSATIRFHLDLAAILTRDTARFCCMMGYI